MDQDLDGPVTVDPILGVVDVLDRDGRARVTLPVRRWPVTIGRAITCDIVLDDPYVAPQHATLGEHEGGLQLTVGDTVNGAWLRKRRVAAGERAELAAGDVVQVGGTRLRVRRAADALAAERRWVPEASGSVRTVLVLALLFSVWNAAELWLRDDPGGRFTDYLPVLIGAPIAVAIWAGFWSVGSKLTRHRFDFWSHTVIALLASLAMGVGGAPAAGVRVHVRMVVAEPHRAARRRRDRLVGGRGAHRPPPARASAGAGGGDGVAVRGRPRALHVPQLRDAGSRVPGALRRHAGAAGAASRADRVDGPLRRRGARAQGGAGSAHRRRRSPGRSDD